MEKKKYYKSKLSPSAINKLDIGQKLTIETDRMFLRRLPGGFSLEYENEGIVTAAVFISNRELQNM